MAATSRLLLALVSLTLLSCGVKGNVKVYFLEPTQGLVRKQQNEILTFTLAKGYFCESPEDFQDTAGCVGGAVKVYVIDPARGLVRKQAGEVKPFSTVRGYLCASPADFKQILDSCTTT